MRMLSGTRTAEISPGHRDVIAGGVTKATDLVGAQAEEINAEGDRRGGILQGGLPGQIDRPGRGALEGEPVAASPGLKLTPLVLQVMPAPPAPFWKKARKASCRRLTVCPEAGVIVNW